MKDALADGWVLFGISMSGEFSSNLQSYPSGKYEVWKQDEVDYFCFALTLWASRIKFKFNKHSRDDYNNRTDAFLNNLKAYFEMGNQETNVSYKLDYRDFINRNEVYTKLF